MYDLKTPLKVINSPEGCSKARECPDCENHGYCEPYQKKDSVCVCDVGYFDTNCQKSKFSYREIELQNFQNLASKIHLSSSVLS